MDNVTPFSKLSTQNCTPSILSQIHGYAEIQQVTGGEGLSPYVVTNTNDSGSGSYREALSQGDRYITFSPTLSSQTISLQSDVFAYSNNITLDGRDAPGLKISTHATKFEGTNYVVAYMNYHFNDGTPDSDGITFRNSPAGGQQFFVYKCHFRNAADGSIDIIWNRGNDVHGTISHCKFEYVDKNILHHAGSPSNEGGIYYLTFDHNWFYKCGSRNPYGRDGYVHYYNNLIEHWGGISNDGQGAYSGFNSFYLIEHNIAIAANAGDIAWNGNPIITPKTKAFSPSWQETNTAIRCENNVYENGAYEVELNASLVSNISAYTYTIATADASLEQYIRAQANSIPPAATGDTDNDGVCDADDLCPGYDDSIDTDADGIPDGCDDCLDALIHTANETIQIDRSAVNTISSNHIIPSNATVTFHAGQSVELSPEFTVQTNAIFEAFIEGCVQ